MLWLHIVSASHSSIRKDLLPKSGDNNMVLGVMNLADARIGKSIGDSMGISYDPLAHDGWADGIEFYRDIKEWAQRYEEKEMVPAQTNKKICDELVPLLLRWIPSSVQPFARQVVGTMMGSHLRYAMI